MIKPTLRLFMLFYTLCWLSKIRVKFAQILNSRNYIRMKNQKFAICEIKTMQKLIHLR